MRNRWQVLVLTSLLAVGAPLHAQYLPAQPVTPSADPLPFAPSTIDAPRPCPMPMPPMQDSPVALPADLPNASTPPGNPCDQNCLFLKLDYLHWWVRHDNLSQVIFTTDGQPSIANDFGALFQPNTQIVGGGDGLHTGTLNGIRATLGINPKCWIPMELTGFFVQSTQAKTFVQSGVGGDPLFARSIYSVDPALNQEVVYLISFPGFAFGQGGILTSTTLYGGEVDAYAWHFCGSPDTIGPVIDFTVGARYAALNEGITIFNNISTLSAAFPLVFNNQFFGPGFTTGVRDSFSTRNQFYGAQVGFRASFPVCSFFNLEFKGNTGVGLNHQLVNTTGFSYLFAPANPSLLPPPPTVLTGGIQAVPSNIGRFTQNKISTIDDFQIALEFPICNWCALSLGYDFMFWSTVIRPGDQIQRLVDTRQVPTDLNFQSGIVSTQPYRPNALTNFWAEGLTLSIAFTY
jgi:hypothetical protein